MYEEFVKELRDSAEWADRLAILMGRTDGDTHAPIMRKAADAIEVLDMKLQGANAAIAGMQREIERMVIDSANSKPKWVPVTERLPKEDETVMTWGKQKVVLLDWLHDNQWCCFGEATYWMPLPEPPKECE